MVLLKGYTNEGFRFFTNYASRKACELVSRTPSNLTLVPYFPEKHLSKQKKGGALVVFTLHLQTLTFSALQRLAVIRRCVTSLLTSS